MTVTIIRFCMGEIRHIFKVFIRNQTRNTSHTLTLYTNMLFITVYGFVNRMYMMLSQSTKYFTKFFSEDWVRHDYR